MNSFTGNIYFPEDCWKPNQNLLEEVKPMYPPSALCLL